MTGRTGRSGRSVLITGGGTGIGRAAALQFAREGASVLVVGRRAEPLAGTVAVIEQGGGSAAWHPADVAVEADVRAAVARAAGGMRCSGWPRPRRSPA